MIPFLIAGDSPQAMIGNLSVDEAASFVANRRAAGFNSLLVDLLCAEYTGCRSDGTTFDGIEPFTTSGDLTTPNPAYFERADAIIRTMTDASIVVFLDPIETGGWLDVLRENGVAAAYRYGQYVGRRYRGVPNLVWWSGNDFQTWRSPADDAVVLAVAEGIKSVDRVTPSHRPARLLEERLARRSSLAFRDRRRHGVHLFRHVCRGAQGVQPQGVHAGRSWREAGYEFEQNEPDASRAATHSSSDGRRTGASFPARRGSSTATATRGRSGTAGRRTSTAPEPAHRLPDEALRREALVPARPGSGARIVTERLRQVREVPQRRLERLRDDRRHARRNASRCRTSRREERSRST